MSNRKIVTGEHVAAIDLGTNSCRVLVADINGNDVFRDVRHVALGEGLAESGLFCDVAIKRAVNAFSDFSKVLKKYNVKKYRAIATAACRMSSNTQDFLAKVKEISKKYLEGIPTSNGYVEGEALVIENVNKKYDVKDKILITKMTDPGWVFLLVNAKGVIAEKGSILSHTAIISREIGIPSIVGVEDVTSIIHSGDLIKMDALTGKIEIVKRSK
jgi:phosphohistidine swiveling domain-containing protein